MTPPTGHPWQNFCAREMLGEKGEEEKGGMSQALAPAPRVATRTPATRTKETRKKTGNQRPQERPRQSPPDLALSPRESLRRGRGPDQLGPSRSGATTKASPHLGRVASRRSPRTTGLPRALVPTAPAADRAVTALPIPTTDLEGLSKRRGAARGGRDSPEDEEPEEGTPPPPMRKGTSTKPWSEASRR
jgi:hypothetical protein